MNPLFDKKILEKIHEKSLNIIEERGIKFHSRKALSILDDAGATITGEIARIPGEVIESALEKAPESFILAAQNPEFDLDLGEEKTHLSLDGCAAHVLDFDTGKKRASSKKDIETMATIGNYLEEIDIISPMVSAQDSFKGARPLHELDGCLSRAEKHVVTESTVSAREARGQIELAAAVAGGKDKLRKRPIFSNFICTISPLTQDKGGIEAGLEFARAGIPVGFYSMATTGVTSPVTLAGTLAVLNAEVISALTLVQLAVPGAKVFYSGGPATFDLKTGAYVASSPEALRLRTAVAEMANFYGIPCHVGAGATSAKIPGFQAAFENAISIMFPGLAGANILFGLGLLDGSNLLTYESVILDCEIARFIRKTMAGIDFSEEAFALDLINKMGPGGVYLDQEHTIKNMRKELSLPCLSERSSYDDWYQRGGKNSVELAREKVSEILDNHQREPLPDEVRREMKEVIEAYRI